MSKAAEFKPPSPRRVRAVRDRLRELYGVPSAPPHGQACRFWPATTTTPPMSSVAARAPAPVRRSRCWTDWAIGGSRMTQSGVLLALTASGQEWDKSDTQTITISNKLSARYQRRRRAVDR